MGSLITRGRLGFLGISAGNHGISAGKITPKWRAFPADFPPAQESPGLPSQAELKIGYGWIPNLPNIGENVLHHVIS